MNRLFSLCVIFMAAIFVQRGEQIISSIFLIQANRKRFFAEKIEKIVFFNNRIHGIIILLTILGHVQCGWVFFAKHEKIPSDKLGDG